MRRMCSRLLEVRSLRFVWLASLPVLLFVSACTPPLAPIPPREEEQQPCQSDDDCELRVAEPSARQARCGPTPTRIGASSREVQDAVCGPMANMNATMPEKQLACFRGTCVPIEAKR